MSKILRQVFNLYKIAGGKTYVGERINQVQHGTQAAMLAEKEGYPKSVILAAFLHDVGHISHAGYGETGDKRTRLRFTDDLTEREVTLPEAHQMKGFGRVNHEEIGAHFLRSYFFPHITCDLVAGHVQAKRYKVTTDEAYYDTLSEASKETLEFQGGRMSNDELNAFWNDPLWETHLKMREWDDKAKSTNPALIAEIENMDAIEKYYQVACEVVPT